VDFVLCPYLKKDCDLNNLEGLTNREYNFSMNMENKFSKENRHHGDPSMGSFKFMGKDKEDKIAELKAQGVPDEDIENAIRVAEDIITNRQAQAKLQQEMGKA